MSNIRKAGINRRRLLSTTAKAALALVGIAGIGAGKATAGFVPGNANAYWTRASIDRYLCSQIHLNKSRELTRMMRSPRLDAAEKNLALRTSHCPSCGVQIQPGGEAAGYGIVVQRHRSSVFSRIFRQDA